jgi:Ino eighty subunit 2
MKRYAYSPPLVPYRSPAPSEAYVSYKAETINRLLKKKSGTRNRRNPLASAEDRTPATHTGNGTPAEGEVDEEESGEAAVVPVAVVEVVPTRYRWISTLRPSPDAVPGDKMLLSFSVPTSLLPASHQPALDADGDTKMEEQEQRSRPPVPPAVCDVEGCTANRKYRLVRDWERGACGMDHLHLLERQPGAVMV